MRENVYKPNSTKRRTGTKAASATMIHAPFVVLYPCTVYSRTVMVNVNTDHTRKVAGRLSRMAWPARPKVLLRALWM